MSNPNKEKSLIDLAREHMDQAGAAPEQGVDIPEAPAVQPSRVVNKEQEPPATSQASSEVFDSTVKEAVASLTSNITVNTEWRAITLPSRGKAYVESNGEVQIRPFTFEDERILRSIKNTSQAADVMKRLFATCVQGLDYPSMTLEDKNYILYKLREISYGDTYTVTMACQACEATNSLALKIADIPVDYAPDDYQEPLLIELPDSKQPVSFVTPRCADENYMTDANSLTDNLWRHIVSVGEYEDERIKQAFLKATTLRDVAYLREHIMKPRYGMKKEVSFECAECGEINESLIPFTESFFSVS